MPAPQGQVLCTPCHGLHAGAGNPASGPIGCIRRWFWQVGGRLLNFLDLVTQVINLRSFSNLWYWVMLAVLWSSLSHWVLGIPYHILQRARRGDAQSAQDLAVLAEINARRIVDFAALSGTVMVGMSCFVVTSLVILGWVYWVEFAQAVVLLLVPLVLATALSVQTARRLLKSGFADLERVLRRHRLVVQLVGIVMIFITTFWGMYTNVTVSPLH